MSKKPQTAVTPLFADPDPLRQPWKPGEPLPTLIRVLRFGDNPGVKGNFRVTERTLANLAARQKDRGRDHVVIDFNHNTCPGTPAYNQSAEPRPVAARKATVVITPDNCIALEAPQWTSEGEKNAEHYADFSPAVEHDVNTGEVISLDSVAMVRNGSIDGLAFCNADGSSVQDENQEDETMKELLAALIAAKLLPESATEADAVKYLTEQISAMKTQMTECGADKIKLLVESSTKDAITALSADLDELKKGREADRKSRICDRALFEGKVIQLDQAAITALSADQLQDHVSKLPATVPLDQRTRVTPANADPGKAYSDEQASIARACGNDPDKVYKKG